MLKISLSASQVANPPSGAAKACADQHPILLIYITSFFPHVHHRYLSSNAKMRIFTRLAVACLASLLCIWTAFCFYPPGQPRLVDVALTNSGHVEHLWRWMAGPSRLERDARIVVLGDHSVVDGNEKHAGKSWPRQWCDMVGLPWLCLITG